MITFVELDPNECYGYDDDGFPTPEPPHKEWEILFSDGEGRCARGHLCANLHGDGGGGIIGGLLYEDDDEPWRSGMRWRTVFYPAGSPDLLFCEDCADEIAEYSSGKTTPGRIYEQTVLSGQRAGLTWFIDHSHDVNLSPDGFVWAWVGSFAPDHGLVWEHEIEGRFSTIAAAQDALDRYFEELEAEEAKWQAQLEAENARELEEEW